jgi:hypothetical protein
MISLPTHYIGKRILRQWKTVFTGDGAPAGADFSQGKMGLISVWDLGYIHRK